MRLRRPHGRAAVDASDPRAWATCGRCGMLYNHEKLVYDKEWIGAQLVTLSILVCEKCSDTPNEQLRAFVLPPDPEPIQMPRPDIYVGQGEIAAQSIIAMLAVAEADDALSGNGAVTTTGATGQAIGLLLALTISSTTSTAGQPTGLLLALTKAS